jgi:hypothetical protein
MVKNHTPHRKPVLGIRDVNPGSGFLFFPSRISDQKKKEQGKIN